MDGHLSHLAETPGPTASGDASSLIDAITQKAKHFALPALVRLLRARFPHLPIRFASHPSLALEPTIVESVSFWPNHIVVTLNLGLRTATTPLASYFLELFAHPRVGPELAGVVEALDHPLLSDFAQSRAPMENERLVERSSAFVRDALTLARPASPMTLGWLLRKVFPELSITVRRNGHARRMPAPNARLGNAVVGYAALGGQAEILVPGIDALLETDSSRTWHGEPWATEAKRRLSDVVFPVLRGAAIHLRVLLVDREALGKLIVHGPGELGFDPLTKARSPEISTLFEGQVL